MNHDQARSQVDRLFTDGLPPPRHVRLRDHLRECDGCRRYYDGVRSVEDAMFAEPAVLNDAAVARMADLAVERPKLKSRRASSWLALFAASATAAAALLFTISPWETPEEEFTARGAADVAAGGLTVFHIDRAAQRVTRVARAPGGAALPLDAVVQLGVTTNELTHLAVLGIDSTYQLHWYQEPTTVPAGVVDEVIGGAWKLSNPGWLRLFAVFASEPIDRVALESAAKRLRGADLSTTEQLPGIDGHQDSILFEVGL